jgi:hypothetical protein
MDLRPNLVTQRNCIRNTESNAKQAKERRLVTVAEPQERLKQFSGFEGAARLSLVTVLFSQDTAKNPSILFVGELTSFEVLVLYSFKCGPIRAHVRNVDVGWTVLVKLFGSEKSGREVSNLGVAQDVAISYARELCSEHELSDPVFLNSPEWIAQPTTDI